MEDLDRPRTVAGAADAILRTLDSLGLISDEPVLYQSSRSSAYAQALSTLRESNSVYRCTCSRTEAPGAYSGHCLRHPPSVGPAAFRLKLPEATQIDFDDAFRGRVSFACAALGDPVVYRRDHIAAYQLAVVVDDAFQGITHVVRGADLLESTAWQIAVSDALGLLHPRYGHLPLVTKADGSKLSKSLGAQAVARWSPGEALERTLQDMGYAPPRELRQESVTRILDWALADWPPSRLTRSQTIASAN
jgi:glutamyl-Q tRNA(Asp) synthetase